MPFNGQAAWLPALIKNPYKANSVLLAGGTVNGASGSHIIELTLLDTQIKVSQWNFNFKLNGGGEITALSHNPIFGNEMYVTTSNGQFFKSFNSGQSFVQTKIGVPGGDSLYGSKVLVSKVSGNRIVLGGSGYNNPAVFLSLDGGNNFQPMIQGLPETTVFDLEYSPDENLIYAATEAGPYVFVQADQMWYDLSEGKAPNQRYYSVEYVNLGNGKIRFGTFGRGIWDFNLADPLSISEKEITEKGIHIYPNPSSSFINLHTESFINKSIQIINSTGQLIESKKITRDHTKIDISHFPNGVYYIIFEGNKNNLVNTFVKI